MVTHFYHDILLTYLETYLLLFSRRGYTYIGLVLKVNKNSKYTLSRSTFSHLKDSSLCLVLHIMLYQSPQILTELFQHNLTNVSYLTACYLYQVMMTLHFLNDVANDAESTQTSKVTS